MKKSDRKAMRDVGRKVSSAFFAAVLSLSTMLGAAAPAFATQRADAADGNVTVTLVQSEGGTASFSDYEGDVVEVKAGTNMHVDLTPDEGYAVGSVALINDNLDIVECDFDENGVDFVANEDVKVAPLFKQNSTFAVGDVETADVVTPEDYILANMDSRYVGEGAALTPADILVVSNTMVRNDFPGTTINDLWLTDNDGDGVTDYLDYFINDVYGCAYLYDVDENADYYVAYPATLDRDARFFEAVAGLDDFTGTVLDDVVYDAATGLCYVPKTYSYMNENNSRSIGAVRLQILWGVDGLDAERNVQVSVSNDGVAGDVADSGVATVTVADSTTSIQLARDEKAIEAVGEGAIDSVKVNGVELDSEHYAYDSETGVLTVDKPAVTADVIEVEMSDTWGKKAGRIFNAIVSPFVSKAYALNVQSADANYIKEKLTFSKRPVAGERFDLTATNGYSEQMSHMMNYTRSAGDFQSHVMGDDFYNMVMVITNGWGLDQSGVDELTMTYMHQYFRFAEVPAQANIKSIDSDNTVTITDEFNILMYCSHTEAPGLGSEQDAMPGDYWQGLLRMTIMAVDDAGDVAVVGFVNPASNGQTGCGYFLAEFESNPIKVQLFKGTDAPAADCDAYVKDNESYSLVGARYGLFASRTEALNYDINQTDAPNLVKDVAGNPVIFEVQNESGITNEFELSEPGTYYVRELLPNLQTFKGYNIDMQVHEITVEKLSEDKTQQFTVADSPAVDPSSLIVDKGASQWKDWPNMAGKAFGDVADFGGIKYRFDYYAGLYDSAEEAAASEAPATSVILATNDKGEIRFGDAPAQDGTEWAFIDSNGNRVIPRGTVVTTEISAIDGLWVTKASTPMVLQIVDSGKFSSTSGQNARQNDVKQAWENAHSGSELVGLEDFWGTNVDQEWRGGVRVVKADIESNESDYQGDADLSGIEYTIYNHSLNSISVDGVTREIATSEKNIPAINPETGEENKDSNEVAKIVTKKVGDNYVAETSQDLLPYGTYQIVETKGNSSYLPVDADGNVISDSQGIISPENMSKAWTRTFTIHEADENGYYIEFADGSEEAIVDVNDAGYTDILDGATGTIQRVFGWNANQVKRGGVIIGKIDNETRQYIPLGEAHLDNAVFEIVNHSGHPVWVDTNKDGQRTDDEVFGNGEPCLTISSEEVEWNGQTIFAAKTDPYALPYGNYSVRETAAGDGYLYNSLSKSWERTFSIGYEKEGVDAFCTENGGYADLTGTSPVEEGAETTPAVDDSVPAINRAQREDFHFTKKQQDGRMERMANVAFLLTSKTTGEKHVIVTDENGAWGSDCLSDEDTSEWPLHTDKTNANDPTSPVSNGAVAVDPETGEWVVVDSSKLDSTAGTWFTGISPELTQWAEDGKSYTVNGVTIPVNDGDRAFPYDTYDMQELRCDANAGFGLVDVTVTLHKYSRNVDGKGINIDYGTIDDIGSTMGTTLTDVDGNKIVAAGPGLVLVDKVAYEGLTPGTTYTMDGELHNVSIEGEDLGIVAKASTEFTPTSPKGTVDVTFEFDATGIEGSMVAFEYLYNGNKLENKHEDLTDKGQTVDVPTLGTTASGVDGNEADASAETITILDTVAYKGLEGGKEYTVTGTLHFKNVDVDGNITDGGIVKDAEGNDVTASAKFRAALSGEGTVDVTFEFANPGSLGGTDIVAFESVERGGTTFATHADIKDEGQTVHFPGVKTTATNKDDATHTAVADEEVTIVDVVELSNLTVGKEYTVSGSMHLKDVDADGNVIDGGVLKDKAGKEAVAEKTFVAGESNMSVTLEFTVDASALTGKSMVAFETLTTNGKQVGSHADLNDEGQTVNVPGIKTNAVSKVTNSHMIEKTDNFVVVVDTVDYSGLVPGKTYQLEGALHEKVVDKDGKVVDGGIIKDDKGKEFVAYGEFTPETPNGQATVEFSFQATGGVCDGKSWVVFETLYQDGRQIAVHADINDEVQTVHFLKVGTTLTGADKKAKDVKAASKVTLVDTVAYENLVPGEKYVLEGTLMTSDGKAVEGATAKAEFTPDKPNGIAEMTFEVDLSKIADGSKLVAFERVYDANGNLLGSHEDLKDEAQTVVVKNDSKTPVSLQTGIDGAGMALVALVAVAGVAGITWAFRRRNEA